MRSIVVIILVVIILVTVAILLVREVSQPTRAMRSSRLLTGSESCCRSEGALRPAVLMARSGVQG